MFKAGTTAFQYPATYRSVALILLLLAELQIVLEFAVARELLQCLLVDLDRFLPLFLLDIDGRPLVPGGRRIRDQVAIAWQSLQSSCVDV